MSHEASAFVKRLKITSSPQKLILLLIAERVDNETFSCFPGQKLLSEEASMSERQVRQHLAALDKDGHIIREARHRQNGSRTSDKITLAGFESYLNSMNSIPIQATGGNPPVVSTTPTGGFAYDQPAEIRRPRIFRGIFRGIFRIPPYPPGGQ